MSELLKKIDLQYSRRLKRRTRALYLVLLGIGLVIFAYFLMGCRPRVLNPSIEERIFFQSEVQCEIVRGECKYFVPGIGPMEHFVIYGQGAFERDQALIQECIDKALIKKKESGK